MIRTLLQPQVPTEATGLLALMLLHDARREARLDVAGDLIVLEQQNRSLWKKGQIQRALPLAEEAMRSEPGPFAIQAAIPGMHGRALQAEDTERPDIVRLYNFRQEVKPAPIVS